MAYQIKCDGYPLLDMRDDDLIVVSPKFSLEANKVGSGSFTIYDKHPYYSKLLKKKSIFEVSDEFGVIFRGRMTDDTLDFDKGKAVNLEGSMAFFNDSIVRPFVFPDDFAEDAAYITASESGNVIKFFLGWLIDNHNSQVQPWQRLKLGEVTVTDPNNYLSRSSGEYASTWETLKSKLFESALGGFLCVRYETDGTYIDYVQAFPLTNTQEITYGENMLDMSNKSDATETYSAIIPIGKTIETTTEAEDGTSITTRETVMITGLPDGNITDDIVKQGDTIYSRSAVEAFGWVYAPVKETTWEDVTISENLLAKGVAWLSGTGVKLSNTRTITAVDLHFSDAQIRSFRVCRNVITNSAPHGLSDVLGLMKLDLDLLNPQNTKISIGDTKLSLTDQNNRQHSDTMQRIESAEKDISENRQNVTEAKQQIITQSTSVINTCEEIILKALESYVETSNYQEFRETVETQLEIMAGEIAMNFTTTTEQINNVDGDLQAEFERLYKYIHFSGETAITIGSGDSAITLEIDNEKGIVFKRNGVQFGLWDGENFYTGNIIIEVNERAQFGNFAFVPRSDGSLSFLKVGG